MSDEPDVDERLADVVARLTGRHDVLWAMVADAPALASTGDEGDGYDVRDGRFVLGSDLAPRVVDAYRRAEVQRRQQLSAFMTSHGIPHAVVSGSASIRNALSAMTEVHARAR